MIINKYKNLIESDHNSILVKSNRKGESNGLISNNLISVKIFQNLKNQKSVYLS